MNYKSVYIILLLIILVIFIINKKENYCNTNIVNTNEGTQLIASLFTNNNNTGVYNNINVNKNITAKNFYADNFKGIIVTWSGSIDNIPTGWGLCDGTTYTDLNGNSVKSPDLRSLFIVGASKPDTPANNTINGPNGQPIMQNIEWLTPIQVGNIGGEETHQLDESEIPVHTHPTPVTGGGCPSHYIPPTIPYMGPSLYVDNSPQDVLTAPFSTNSIPGFPPTPNISIPSGDYINHDEPHNNMPPYMALAYIIKI